MSDGSHRSWPGEPGAPNAQFTSHETVRTSPIRAALSRRQLLQPVAAGAVGMTTVGAVLAACGVAASPPGPAPTSSGGGSTSPPPPLAPTSAGPRLPTYIAFPGPKPDLPASSLGVDPAYFTFPANLVKSVQETPGQGGDVTAVGIITGALPTPMEQNAAWQEVNKQLGVTFRLSIVDSGDYRSRLNTIIAGGDLPDLIYNIQANITNAPDLMRAQCADLSPYLDGAAIKDYPNLANLPTASWRSTTFNGSIYAVPVPRNVFGTVTVYRKDIFDQAGIQKMPGNADDFKRLLQQLTSVDANAWGISSTATSTISFGLATGNIFPAMFRAPNNWSVNGGKLTKDFETTEYRAAVAYVRDLYASGVYTPNSVTNTSLQTADEFRAGKAVMYATTWGAFAQTWDVLAQINPRGRAYLMPPLSADGGKVEYQFGNSNFGMTFLKKASPDRVKMLLRVLNYLAAPFGSQEGTLLQYGLQGVHWNPDADGNQVLTDKGKVDTLIPWRYLTTMAPVLYTPNFSREFATMTHDVQEVMAPVGVADPTLGLFSAADARIGTTIGLTFYTGIVDVVVGRRPLSDVDQLVSEWRGGGGDVIRTEYAAQLGASA